MDFFGSRIEVLYLSERGMRGNDVRLLVRQGALRDLGGLDVRNVVIDSDESAIWSSNRSVGITAGWG